MNTKQFAIGVAVFVNLTATPLTASAANVDEPDASHAIGAAEKLAYLVIKPVDDDDSVNSGGGGGSTAGPAELSVAFDKCTNATRRSEMRSALQDLLDNWSAFKANLAKRNVTSEHACMYDRLTPNGNVQCDACDGAGHSSPFGQTANVCRDWAIGIEASYPSSSSSRKVCWSSVIMHEFGHTCERFEGGAELIDNAARETLNDLYGQSLLLDSDCNQDL